MREAEFRAWFEANDHDATTIGTELARAKRIEQNYGDLDAHFGAGKLAALKAELSYSADDERADKPNPAKFPIDGNIRDSMASYCSTIDYYTKFCEASKSENLPERKHQLAAVNALTAEDIIATMDQCDAVGIDQFLRPNGFVRPSRWILRPDSDQRYPAKATVATALGRLPQGKSLTAKEFFGGFGEAQAFARLEELGFELTGKAEDEDSSMAILTHESVEAAMDECDRLGEAAFIEKRGFGPSRDYRVLRDNGQSYPSKPIAGVALGYLPGGTARTSKNFNGGYSGKKSACNLLEAAGYRIIPVGGGNVHSKVSPVSLPMLPTNLILYGPPGTGKTYNTALEAVALCDGQADYPPTREGRRALMARYNALQRKGRIGFVTFHQNFSYEDFVEGLRPQQAEADEESGAGTGFSLVPRDGVFKQIAKVAAENKGRAITTDLPPMDGSRKIFKMSLGRSWSSEDDVIFENALAGKYVVLGWGGNVDWSNPKYDNWGEIKKRWRQDHPDASGNDPNMSQMYTFRANMEIGSIIVISDGNMKFRAIAEITGPYEFQPGPDGEYNHRRSVRWLWQGTESLPRERIYRKSLSQVSAYQMRSASVEWEALGQIISSSGDAVATSGDPESYVLIIDEINRANVSKVFGELITLIEPDKRAGMDNALSVKLPYSGDAFTVPANLHIIGTMNTADRSIALLDTALRRRFNFREIAPEPGLLRDASKRTGIDLVRVLSTINQRIEYLIDREHRIGHAFFIGCATVEQVHAVMRDKVIPLLQEYFFEDWGRIHAVLGDGFIQEDKLDPPPGIEGDRVSSWSVLSPFKLDAFDRLTGKAASAAEETGE